MLKIIYAGLLAVITSFSSLSAVAGGVSLGATRVIYLSDSRQGELTITNTDADNGFLVQSWVDNPNGSKNKNFVITPPLYVLGPAKENALRIIYTGHKLPADRESLFWVNVKVIPSIDDALKTENTMQIAIQNRIKMFYRPVEIGSLPADAAGQLTLSSDQGRLSIRNPTPWYQTLVNLTVDGKLSDESVMLAPFAAQTLVTKAQHGSRVSYQTINDYGAQSEKLSSLAK